MTTSTKAPRQLFLGNIAYAATESDIRIALEGLGISVDTVRLGIDQLTGRARGFAFVDLADDEPSTIDELIQIVNGLMIHERPCRADVAHAPKASTASRESGNHRRDRGGVVPHPPKTNRFRSRRSEFEGAWRDDD